MYTLKEKRWGRCPTALECQILLSLEGEVFLRDYLFSRAEVSFAEHVCVLVDQEVVSICLDAEVSARTCNCSRIEVCDLEDDARCRSRDTGCQSTHDAGDGHWNGSICDDERAWFQRAQHAIQRDNGLAGQRRPHNDTMLLKAIIAKRMSRLMGSVLMEIHERWMTGKKYFTMERYEADKEEARKAVQADREELNQADQFIA